MLAVEATATPKSGASALPPGAAEVLTDERSLDYLAPMARMFGAVGRALPDLLDGVSHRRRRQLGASSAPTRARRRPT